MDELHAADLVRPSATPLRFGFRHPLVRHAVYESAPGGWRIGAHARAAATLAALGAAAVSRAHHVERSARPGDATAVAVLIEAGDATAGRAPATAALWYEAALRLMPETTAERPRRLEVLMALAPTLAAIGRLEDSRAALLDVLEMLDLVAPDDNDTADRRRRSVRQVELLLGRHRDADARLHRALAEPPDPVSVEVAALHIAHSLAARYEGEFEGMRTWAQRWLRRRDRLRAAVASGVRGRVARPRAGGAAPRRLR